MLIIITQLYIVKILIHTYPSLDEYDEERMHEYLLWMGCNTSEDTISNVPNTNTEEDYVYNYACSTLSLGLVFQEFEDAIREGDGDREERIWKLLLLIFKAKVRRKGSRTKYAFEAFRYIALLNSLLTPRMAHKLKWGRFVNTSGRHGNNIACDLRVEHEVRKTKELLSGIGGKLDEKNSQRVVKAQQKLDVVVSNFDRECEVNPQCSTHTKLTAEIDVDNMLCDIKKMNAFRFQAGRQHKAFPGHAKSIVQDLDMGNVLKWIKRLVKRFSKGYQTADETEDSDDGS